MKGFVYILFNKKCGTLYCGVTSDLAARVAQHKEKQVEGFSKKYGTDNLGYYEGFPSIKDAIAREKQIKAGSRKDKTALIQTMNPLWKDLQEDISL